jgi:hypothetical protein
MIGEKISRESGLSRCRGHVKKWENPIDRSRGLFIFGCEEQPFPEVQIWSLI